MEAAVDWTISMWEAHQAAHATGFDSRRCFSKGFRANRRPYALTTIGVSDHKRKGTSISFMELGAIGHRERNPRLYVSHLDAS